VCADQGAVGSDGTQVYCCSAQVTPCAYDPVATCDPGTVGYQCRGADRPEALNAAIHCNQGVRQGDLIDYCCSGAARTPACIQSASLGCSAALMGWICPAGALPTAQDLLANQSRADVYYQLCPVPKQADNPNQNIFCCYTQGWFRPVAAVFRILRFPDVSRAGSASLATGPTRPTRTTRRSPVPTRAFLGSAQKATRPLSTVATSAPASPPWQSPDVRKVASAFPAPGLIRRRVLHGHALP